MLAYALMENAAADGGEPGRVTSMEDDRGWFETASARLPESVRAVVDNHYLTFYILQKVVGVALARYSVSHKLMFVGPVTRDDVRFLRKESFLPDLRLFSTTELKLRMARQDEVEV